MGVKQQQRADEKRRFKKAELALEYEHITGRALPIEQITAMSVRELSALVKAARANQAIALEEFRATLPAYRQHEYYTFLHLRWDIVKALYIVSKPGRKLYAVDVARSIHTTGLDVYVPVEGAGASIRAGFIHIDPEAAMGDDIDVDRPLLAAQIQLTPGGDTHNQFLDGFHRLYKAWKLGRETMTCYVLSPEEERNCRT